MKYLFLFLCCLIELVSFGQKEEPIIPPISNLDDKETRMYQTVFIINSFSYKRIEEKKDKQTLRLGIQSEKLFVVDSLGNAQPYVIDNYDCSLSKKGGGIEMYSCIGNSITSEILSTMEKCEMGSKIFFDGVVVRDSNLKSWNDIVIPLIIQRIK